MLCYLSGRDTDKHGGHAIGWGTEDRWVRVVVKKSCHVWGRLRIPIGIRGVGRACVRVCFYTYAYTGYNKNRSIDRQGCVKGV